MNRAVVLTGLALVCACSRPAQDQAAPLPSGPAGASGAVPVPAATLTPNKPAPPAATVALPSTARDPAQVLLVWAKAMSLKQWDSAYLYWGDHGARSGLTLAQFKASWSRLGNPELELHKGGSEGAAGSSFYTAPLVLIDGQRRVGGEIVLRRVNDVDGASAEQLRWHIESLSIEP